MCSCVYESAVNGYVFSCEFTPKLPVSFYQFSSEKTAVNIHRTRHVETFLCEIQVMMAAKAESYSAYELVVLSNLQMFR